MKGSRNIDGQSPDHSYGAMPSIQSNARVSFDPHFVKRFDHIRFGSETRKSEADTAIREMKKKNPQYAEWKRPDVDHYWLDATPEKFIKSIDKNDSIQVVPPGKSILNCPIYPANICKIKEDMAPYTIVYSPRKEGKKQNIRYTSYRMGRQDK